MGFFDIKAVCAICNKEVGLNRFKIGKSEKWICLNCLNKAGGMWNVNLLDVTVEDIRLLIKQSEEKAAEQKEKIDFAEQKIAEHEKPSESNDTVSSRTAEGMYEYCLKNFYSMGISKKWDIRHLRVIQNNLISDEKVLMTFLGFYKSIYATQYDGIFAYAVTNTRIIIAKKRFIGKVIQSIVLENVNDITVNSGIINGIITVDTYKEVFNIRVDNYAAQKISVRLNEIINEIKQAKKGNINIKNMCSANQIKKYKELLDLGAITQQEFDIKKKQLLNL